LKNFSELLDSIICKNIFYRFQLSLWNPDCCSIQLSILSQFHLQKLFFRSRRTYWVELKEILKRTQESKVLTRKKNSTIQSFPHITVLRIFSLTRRAFLENFICQSETFETMALQRLGFLKRKFTRKAIQEGLTKVDH
jgi:hypothetical protein